MSWRDDHEASFLEEGLAMLGVLSDSAAVVLRNRRSVFPYIVIRFSPMSAASHCHV
jgi:hypothetical protein